MTGLEKEYRALEGQAQAFAEELSDQLARLLRGQGIALAFPVQRRFKRWDSIVEKFERLALEAKNIREVQDLVGLRIVLLFSRDIEPVEFLIRNRLDVIREYDTGDRLKEDQFGYTSKHFIARLPSAWLSIPSFEGMGDLQAEIQLRTLAQHMWAEASHVLQYKREDTVPKSMRRALYRASAILETVDLEFDRILNDRKAYRETADIESTDAVLDVDLLEKVLDSQLPAPNKSEDEGYAELLEELRQLGIETVPQLQGLVRKHLRQALKVDREFVKKNRLAMERGGVPPDITTPERTASGVFFTHVGLARQILREEFGKTRIIELLRRRSEKAQ